MRTNAINPSLPKRHTAAKVAGAVVTTAAAAGTVLYLAKTGKLNQVEGGNKIVEKFKAVLKKPADFVNGKIDQGIAKLSANERLANKMTKVKTFMTETAENLQKNPKVVGVKTKVSEGTKAVKGFFESIPSRISSLLEKVKGAAKSAQ